MGEQLSKTLNKIFYILPKGDPLKFAVLLLLMFVAAVMEVAGLSMIPAFVAIIADPQRVMQIDWLQSVFSILDITSKRDLLLWGSGALVGIFIIKSVYIIAFNYFEAHFVYRRQYSISHRLMRSYMQAPYIFHLQKNTAVLLRNITQEINVLINNVIASLLKMTREVVMALGILVFLFFMEPLITLVIISLSVFGAGAFILFNKNKMKDYGEEEQECRSQMIKALNQGLGGIKDARVLNREEEFIEKFRIQAYRSTQLKAYIRFMQQVPRPVVETTAVLGVLVVAGLLVWQNRPMDAIIPILALFAIATVRMMPSIQTIVTLYTNLRYNLVSLSPIYDDLKELESDNARFNDDRNQKDKLKFENEIQIQNLSYHYPGSDEQALNEITLTIAKGEAVAFVGSSGAGKTTLVDIILGLFEPDEGEIYVDGVNVRGNLSAWQRNVGYIPQTIYLADETLRANVAFGLPKNEIDDNNVMDAIKLAQLERLLKQLPDGLDTIIGENGTRLSGGQQQRLGIARALYHKPKVLVMDEATSALDNITEKQIINAIEALKDDHTLIMIAHRLTTVKNCDKLYFMEHGNIVQAGSYHNLVDSNIKFREMALEGSGG